MFPDWRREFESVSFGFTVDISSPYPILSCLVLLIVNHGIHLEHLLEHLSCLELFLGGCFLNWLLFQSIRTSLVGEETNLSEERNG